MEFLILDGNPDPANTIWKEYLSSYRESLSRFQVNVKIHTLINLDLRFCRGCWSCWWATPGLCSIRDDMEKLYPDIIRADVLIWASPLVMGNVSALIKKTQDRMIPLLHPFVELVHGECHHRRRYHKDIDMGILLQPGPGDTPLDLDIVTQQHQRLALNGRGRLLFSITTQVPAATAAEKSVAACNSTDSVHVKKEAHHEAIGA